MFLPILSIYHVILLIFDKHLDIKICAFIFKFLKNFHKFFILFL